jgi:hypothetical protein
MRQLLCVCADRGAGCRGSSRILDVLELDGHV